MQTNDASPQPAMPLLAAADLQGHLLMVANDLDRLGSLLGDACGTLSAGFCAASQQLREMRSASTPAQTAADKAIEHLADAVTALQFQDMASQLIAHTRQRLRHCSDRLARDAFADDADDDEDGDAMVEPAPLRPNPVVQDEMDAGSVELF